MISVDGVWHIFHLFSYSIGAFVFSFTEEKKSFKHIHFIQFEFNIKNIIMNMVNKIYWSSRVTVIFRNESSEETKANKLHRCDS